MTNVSSRSNRRPKVFDNRYYGHLNDILECDFESFKLVLFDIKWYRIWMNEHDTYKIVIQNDNVFTMVLMGKSIPIKQCGITPKEEAQSDSSLFRVV